SDARPIPARAALTRIAVGSLGGGLFALAAVLWVLGTDLSDALFTSAFWMKWTYSFALTAIALWLCLRLARPERTSGRVLLALAVPCMVLAIAAIVELATTPAGERVQVWLGRSALVC